VAAILHCDTDFNSDGRYLDFNMRLSAGELGDLAGAAQLAVTIAQQNMRPRSS
jgi:hypothetical protein